MLLIVGAWGLSELNRPAPPPPKPPPPAAPSRMETLSLTEISGRRQALGAGRRNTRILIKIRMQVKISGVKVDFFGPGEHVKVKADEGLFHTKTRVLTLKGNVEMDAGRAADQDQPGHLRTRQPGADGPGRRAPDRTDPEGPGQGPAGGLAEKKLVLAQHRLTEVKVQEGS